MKYTILTALIVQFLYTTNDDLPNGRVTGNLIFSPQTKTLLLIDGYTSHPTDGTNNVYSWDGKDWKKIPASGPDSKSLSSAALDTKNNKIVVFGGIGNKGYQSLHGDTWTFDGSQWQQVATNDIGKVAPGEPCFAALLTPQGKIIVDFIVVEAEPADGGGFLLDCPRALAPTLVEKLNFYKLRATIPAAEAFRPLKSGGCPLVSG